MAETCLLDRLFYAVNPRVIAGMTHESVVQQSIVQHLTRLLNTRKGSAPIDPDYGLTDMNNIAGSFAVGSSAAICAEIALQIDKYEPRLTRPRLTTVKETKEIIALRFELNAQLTDVDGNIGGETFAMYVVINSAGRVRLEPRRDR